MRWNLGRHLRNANVIRKVVKGLHAKIPTSGATARPNAAPQKIAKSPKPPPIVPTTSAKSRVQKVTGGGHPRNTFGRKKLATKLNKMRGSSAGRAQLRSQVARNRTSADQAKHRAQATQRAQRRAQKKNKFPNGA